MPCSNVVDTLKRVHAGDLPFDRTVKVSLTENLEKDKILQRMPHNLKTLERLLEQNVDDFTRGMRDRHRRRRQTQLPPQPPHSPPQGRHARRRAVDPHAKSPAADEEAGADLRADGRAGKENPGAAGPRTRPPRKTWPTAEKELREMMLITLEEPGTLRKRVEIMKKRFQEYEQAKRDLSGGNLRLVVSHRQEIPQSRPVASST